MFKVIVFEDAASDARVLLDHISRYGKEHSIQFQTIWEQSAVALENATKDCDLIFMDIELPGFSGMDAATLLRTFDTVTPIIFVTNLAQYAVRGYEVNALDFLVKPVSYYSFSLRMTKALRVMHDNQMGRLSVRMGRITEVLRVEEVTYVEIKNHALAYHREHSEPVITRSTMAEAEAKLAGFPFVRVSKSYLVNMRHISSFNSREVTLFTGEVIPMGRTMRAEATEKIVNYLGSMM